MIQIKLLGQIVFGITLDIMCPITIIDNLIYIEKAHYAVISYPRIKSRSTADIKIQTLNVRSQEVSIFCHTCITCHNIPNKYWLNQHLNNIVMEPWRNDYIIGHHQV